MGIYLPLITTNCAVLGVTILNFDNNYTYGEALLNAFGAGVGFFLSVCMLRILTGMKLRYLLLGCYALIFLLAAFTDADFLGIAFDSGGVTTGPMTVPFILALGVGVAHIRSDRSAGSDSFGLVALCSVGPILAVLILGFFHRGADGVVEISSAAYESSADIGTAYLRAIPAYLAEMALALAPIAVIFIAFQVLLLRLPKRSFLKTCIGMLYTYVGLVLFLTGVNVGFSALGAVSGWTRYLLIPVSALLGWFIISAEPAVAVLEKQIEEVSAGAISGKVIKRSLSVAISLAMALSMLRVVTGISLLWFLIPGYAAALAMSFFVPDIYTAIAFDSGGVASGPMTATFMLQLVIGACSATGGSVLRDAFGLVAMVAMLPLLSIQTVGFFYERKNRAEAAAAPVYGDLDIVELWEEDAA